MKWQNDRVDNMISAGGDFSAVGYSGQAPSSSVPLPEPAKPLGVNLGPTITSNLQSQKIADKIVGVKTLLAVMSKGENVSEFFPLVVQEITSEDETLRHLAYVYLVHYAELDPESALMSVNTFQRSLSDSDPIVRTYALKVLSSIRSQDILDLVTDAVTRCASDLSPYVRKAAALAIIKVYETGKQSLPELLPVLQRLLHDQSVIPIGGAVYAIEKIYQDNDDLIHPLFRTLCSALSRMDPWAQTTTLHILLRYSRRCFKKPTGTDDWALDNNNDDEEIDPDLDLLIKSVQPLLCSLTPAVTLAAATIFVYVAPSYKLQLIVKPLIRFIYLDSTTAYAGLSAISSIITLHSDLFVPHLRHFFLNEGDTIPIKLQKIGIMGQLARPSNADLLIRELNNYVTSPSTELAAAAVNAMGRAANSAGDAATSCFSTIFRLLESQIPCVQAEAMKMLCLLIRPLPRPPVENDDLVPNDIDDTAAEEADVKNYLGKLLNYFGKIDDADAKASLISLIGDKAHLIPLQAHEVLRQLAANFTLYPIQVKIQTLSLAAKVFITRGKESVQLVQYVISLGSHDIDLGVRDTARLYHSLLSKSTESQYILNVRKRAEEFLFPQKPVPVWGGDILGPEIVELGSISQWRNEFISQMSHTVQWADPDKLPNPNVRSEIAEDEDEHVIKIPEEEEDSDDMEAYLFGDSKPVFTGAPQEQQETPTTPEEEEQDIEDFLAN